MVLLRFVPAIILSLFLQSGATWAVEPVTGHVGPRGPAQARLLKPACDVGGPCRQAGPGPADRDVRTFAGSLGRPCGYRWRATPEGSRKVRVCF